MDLGAVIGGSLVDGATYFLTAAGFAWLYLSRRPGLFHLAQGGIMLAAVGSFNRLVHSGWDLAAAFLFGLCMGSALSLAIELAVYRPLRRRDSSSDSFLLASFGLMIVLQRLTSIGLGTQPLYLPSHTEIARRVQLFGMSATLNEWLAVVAAGITAVGITMLRAGRFGQRCEAVAQSPLTYDWHGGSSAWMLAGIAGLSGFLAALATLLDHLDHRIVLSNAALGYLLPAFVIVLLAQTLTSRLALRLPAARRSASVERGAFVAGLWLVAQFLGGIGRLSVLLGDPRWKDAIFLVIAILCVATLAGRRAQQGEEAAAA